MQKCFLTATILFSLFSLELFSTNIPLDRRVHDSLFRIMPHGNQVQQALIYLKTADVIRETMPQKSFSYILSVFRIAILEKNFSLKALARMKMGDYYIRNRKFMQAQEQYLAAYNTYLVSGDTTGVVNALLSIGIMNNDLHNYKIALDYFQMCMNMIKRTNDAKTKGIVFENIAVSYKSMGDNETALYFFNKALDLFRLTGDIKNEFHVKNNIGNIYLDENRYEEALIFFNKLLLETGLSDKTFTGILYTRIGHIYFKKNDHRTSLKYNLMALETRQQNHEPISVASSLINVAGDYYNLGIPDSGGYYMDSGLFLAQKYDMKRFTENGYRHLYNYYLRQGDYSKALNNYGRYCKVHDEINRERNRNNYAILETNHLLQRIQQSGKKFAMEHDIQSLNLKYHYYQAFFLEILTGLAGFSTLIFIFLLLYTRRVRHKMQELNVQLSDEIREREATEAQTRDRENQYKFITDNSVDFITHMDSLKNQIYASPASINVYGYEPEEILTKSTRELTHQNYQAFTESKFREMVETRSSRQFIYQAQKKNGTYFWVESILNPLFDPISGVFNGMVGVTRDIQERKTKELEIMEGTKQKENLLKEIHHRVKNNFAILVSLINMQMAQTKNQELLQSLTNLQLRIRTMSLVHEMLYRSNDFEKISFPGYLRSLASVIAGTYNRRDIDLIVEADESVMDIDASIPLGLIINEILSNAYKHAFPAGRAGKIQLRYTTDPKSGLNTVIIRDDGIGLASGINLDQYKTMGLQIVQILCAQIESTLVVANDPGASFTISFQTTSK